MRDRALLLALRHPRSVALPWMVRASLMDFDERDGVAVAADASFRNINPLAVVML
jgi:hypothetical protein